MYNTNSNLNANNFNNSVSKSHLSRTPLQPKINKNIQIDSNAKKTPLKSFDNIFNSQLNFKANLSQAKNEKGNFINSVKIKEDESFESSEIKFDNNFINYENEMGLNYNEIIYECDYNRTKDCQSHHNSNMKEIKISLESPLGNLHLTSTDDKSSDEEDKLVKRALDFFENENFIYVTKTDLKIREKIENYIHEDLYYYEDENEN